MTPTKDEPVDDIPMVAPARDEIASYKRKRGGNSRAKSATTGLGGGAKFMIFLCFLLALAAALGAGYLFQELQKSNDALASTTTRVQSLEERLSSTGESITASAVTHGVQIKELKSEVDKLWAARRKNLAEMGEYSNKLAGQDAKLQKSAQQQKGQLDVLVDKIEAVQAIERKVKALLSGSVASQARLSELEEILDTLGRSSGSASKRVDDLDGWVKSFNAYRKQVNQKINRLEDAQQAPTTLAPSTLGPQ